MKDLSKRNTLTWVTGIIILVVLNGLIFQKEWQSRNGTVVRLALSPVDPRSRLQGDYMQIRYAFSEEIAQDTTLPWRGRLLFRLDDQLVGEMIGVEGRDETNATGAIALNYRKTRWDVSVGAGTFFFQEGHAEYYEDAAFGELRVDRWGSAMLVALLDSSLNRLEPPPAVQ